MTQEEYKEEVRRIRARLLTIARRYLDDDDAEDVVQDVLLRLWQMHERLRPPIEGLATVLTRNICIDLLRRRRNSVSCQTLAIEAPEVGQSERLERLMAVVDRLPDVQQTLLRLRHMQGMEMKELATLPDLIVGASSPITSHPSLLAPDGVFVLEHGKDYDFSQHPHFVEHRSYGSVNFSLFK